MTKLQKILSLIIVVVIVAGLVVIFTKGFNLGLTYGDSKRIVIAENTDMNGIKEIANEIFGKNKFIIQEVGEFPESIGVTVKEANDEQLNLLATKINEKYGKEITKDNFVITEVAKTKIGDIINPYTNVMIAATAFIIAYIIIVCSAQKNKNLVKIAVKFVLGTLAAQLLLFSVYALARIPVNELLMPISLLVYVLTVGLLSKSILKK
ncbi:MAG: hypothetical protein LBL91_02700 [Lachnospiraceae bacterium]|jgi:preprotein translocase subunit SecF|nr:hypothetical protein [Lachnospiraceae bacterium]